MNLKCKFLTSIAMKNLFLIFTILISINSRAASFDCAKAVTKIENSICASPALSKLDSELANIYDVEVLVNPDPDGVKAAQRAWLRETRNKCTDENCLITVYQQRIAALRGPDPVDAPTREEMQGEDDALSAEELTKQEADAEKNRIAQDNIKKSQEDLLKAQAEFMAAAKLEKEKIAEERVKLEAKVERKINEDVIEKRYVYSVFAILAFLIISFLAIKFSIRKIKNKSLPLKNRTISKNFSVSKEGGVDDLIKNKKQEEDAEIKMKLDALCAERNKKIKEQQEKFAKLKVELNEFKADLNEGLKSNVEKFKKYITKQYYFYSENNFEKLKSKFNFLIDVYLVNFNKLSLNKKIAVGLIVLVFFGFVLEQFGFNSRSGKTAGQYWAAMDKYQKEATCKRFLFASDVYVSTIISGGDFWDSAKQWHDVKEEVAPGSAVVVYAMVKGIDKHKNEIVKSYLRSKPLFIATMAQYCMEW